MIDQADREAEELLIQFPDDWSPSCRRVREVVAAKLRELYQQMINLTAQLHARELAGYRQRDLEIERLKAENAEWKHCYDLRGKALQMPCLKCGHIPDRILAMQNPPKAEIDRVKVADAKKA